MHKLNSTSSSSNIQRTNLCFTMGRFSTVTLFLMHQSCIQIVLGGLAEQTYSDCAQSHSGTLANTLYTSSSSFALTNREDVFISTCDSQFDTYVSLFLNGEPILDRFNADNCGGYGWSYPYNEYVSLSLQPGSYQIVVGAASLNSINNGIGIFELTVGIVNGCPEHSTDSIDSNVGQEEDDQESLFRWYHAVAIIAFMILCTHKMMLRAVISRFTGWRTTGYIPYRDLWRFVVFVIKNPHPFDPLIPSTISILSHDGRWIDNKANGGISNNRDVHQMTLFETIPMDDGTVSFKSDDGNYIGPEKVPFEKEDGSVSVKLGEEQITYRIMRKGGKFKLFSIDKAVMNKVFSYSKNHELRWTEVTDDDGDYESNLFSIFVHEVLEMKPVNNNLNVECEESN